MAVKKDAINQFKIDERNYIFDLFLFGNISLDIIKTIYNEHTETGGAVLHAAWTAHQLGLKIAILTKTSEADLDRIKEFPIKHIISASELNKVEEMLKSGKELELTIDGKSVEELGNMLIWHPSQKTTSIENDYLDRTMETRVCTNEAEADGYEIKEFPEQIIRRTKVVQYCGLVTDEINNDIIKYLAGLTNLAIDSQGMLRKVYPDKSMEFSPWENFQDVLPYITFFKADAAEAQYLTGIETETTEGRIEAAKMFRKWGANEILISHNKELILLSGKEIIRVPFKNRSLAGRTGRGDTSFTAYIGSRLYNPPKDALLLSAALTSLKMEIPGPFKKTRKDVEDYIKNFYDIKKDIKIEKIFD
ncbi:MAG: PfkB family carbohydrate kinase [Promethearchaeota archaeon]